MRTIDREITSSTLLHLMILLILGASLLFINLGSRPLEGSEGRWGEAAKEMLQSGNYIVPQINAMPYRDKPVGSYWLIVLASLPGGKVTEWSARLPTAAATLLSIFLLYIIARAFWDEKTAFLSALIFMTTFSLLRWSRTANADTLTIAGMLGSVYFFVKSRAHPEKGTWLYSFFIIAAVTSLMKGLLGFVLPSLAVFPYLLLKNRDIFFKKRFLFHLMAASIIGGGLFLIPFYLDYHATHSDMSLYLVFKENILRFFKPFDHKKSFFFYFYYIFITLSPWTLLLPFLIWSLKKHGLKKDEGVFFSALWFATLFTFFTLSGSKRGYYILPVIVPFSALLGFFISDTFSSTKHSRAELRTWFFPGTVCLLSGITLLFLLLFHPRFFAAYVPHWITPYLYTLMGCLFLAAVSIPMAYRQRLTRAFILLFAGFYLLQGITFDFIITADAKRDPFVPFCKKVNIATKGGKLAVFHSADQSTLYFYLNEPPPVACFYLPDLARDFLLFHRHSYLIVKGEDDLSRLRLLLKHFKIVLKEASNDPKAFLLITLPKKADLQGKKEKRP